MPTIRCGDRIVRAGIFSMVLLATACASTRGPIVDKQGVNEAQYQQDLAACQQYADQVRVGGKALAGAAGGAAVGAALGEIFESGRGGGARRGASGGAVVGGAKGAASGVQERNEVVKNCLRGRGYSVLN